MERNVLADLSQLVKHSTPYHAHTPYKAGDGIQKSSDSLAFSSKQEQLPSHSTVCSSLSLPCPYLPSARESLLSELEAAETWGPASMLIESEPWTFEILHIFPIFVNFTHAYLNGSQTKEISAAPRLLLDVTSASALISPFPRSFWSVVIFVGEWIALDVCPTMNGGDSGER